MQYLEENSICTSEFTGTLAIATLSNVNYAVGNSAKKIYLDFESLDSSSDECTDDYWYYQVFQVDPITFALVALPSFITFSTYYSRIQIYTSSSLDAGIITLKVLATNQYLNQKVSQFTVTISSSSCASLVITTQPVPNLTYDIITALSVLISDLSLWTTNNPSCSSLDFSLTFQNGSALSSSAPFSISYDEKLSVMTGKSTDVNTYPLRLVAQFGAISSTPVLFEVEITAIICESTIIPPDSPSSPYVYLYDKSTKKILLPEFQ
jgi:hypothetical protein